MTGFGLWRENDVFSSLGLFHASRVCFFPSRMLFNFECKKVLFKDFFPILLLCMLEEQMALKHVIVQAGLRAGSVRRRSLIGRTCHRDFDFQLPITGDSDCSLKLGFVYILDNDLWTKETHSPTARQNFSLLSQAETDKEGDHPAFTEGSNEGLWNVLIRLRSEDQETREQIQCLIWKKSSESNFRK